jgi:hypothetical protein
MMRLAMEEADRFLRFFIAAHRDEGESAGLAREFVLHQRGFGNSASLGKEVLEVDFSGVEGKIPDVEFVSHFGLFVGFANPELQGSVSDFRISNCHWNSAFLKNTLRTQLAIYQGLN